MSRLSFRSVFVSDVHLGLRDCQAGYLLDFLRSMHCERLYLVGDIIDFENMQKRPFWHADHGEVLAEILAIVARGTQRDLHPGQSRRGAAPLRRPALRRRRYRARCGACRGRTAGAIASATATSTTATSTAPEWLLVLGDVLQGFICGSTAACNGVMRRLGLHYRPLSIMIKTRIADRAHASSATSRRASPPAARADGFDGHICGHIHYGRIARARRLRLHQRRRLGRALHGAGRACRRRVRAAALDRAAAHAGGAARRRRWRQRVAAPGRCVIFPLPLAGEGWGEGKLATTSPHPACGPTLPRGGRGGCHGGGGGISNTYT